MIFNGAPSFMASLKKDSASCNTINIKDGNENVVQIIATGFPSHVGAFVPVAESKEVLLV